MNEGLPYQDKNFEEEQILRDAEYVVNAMWEKAMDVSDLPLSVDLSYKAWSDDLEVRKKDFARVLFNKARESNGDENFFAAKTLNRLMKLLNKESQREILGELMTTLEAIKELVTTREQEIESIKTKKERIKSKFKKILDKVFLRDDDFDENIK